MSEQVSRAFEEDGDLPRIGDVHLVRSYRDQDGEVTGDMVMARFFEKAGFEPEVVQQPLQRRDGTPMVIDGQELTGGDYLSVASSHVDPSNGKSAADMILLFTAMHESHPKFEPFKAIMRRQVGAFFGKS